MRTIVQTLSLWAGGTDRTLTPVVHSDVGARPASAPIQHGRPFRELLDSRQTKGPTADARERGLVWAVMGMLRNQALPGEAGRRAGAAAVRERALLFSDRPLAAYWLSVSRGGSPAWEEETARFRRTKASKVQKQPAEHRLGMSDSGSVKALMSIYRQWGSMLLDAQAEQGLDDLAADALAAWDAL